MLSRLENHGFNKFSPPGYFCCGAGSRTAPKVGLEVHSQVLINSLPLTFFLSLNSGSVFSLLHFCCAFLLQSCC